jgi:5-methyltetrahydrofolate--homocysteine methyltransferase
MSNILGQIKSDLLGGNLTEVVAEVQRALEERVPAQDILNKGLIAGMDEVGHEFKEGKFFIPEVLIRAKAMHAGLELLRPYLAGSEAHSLGTVVIGTVAGDLHDIGKNLVAMMMEGAGFEIIDLGVNVTPEKFVDTVKMSGAQVLGMSALLTTTMPSMKTTIEGLSRAGLRKSVKVLVGGAPVTAAFAKTVGADAYAPDAATAVDTARALLK